MSQAQSDIRLGSKRCLTLEVVKAIAAAAETEAIKNNWKVSIAIVDDGANLLYLARLDGAQIASTDVALGKARTAMRYKRPSKALEDAVAGGRTALVAVPGITPYRALCLSSTRAKSSAPSAFRAYFPRRTSKSRMLAPTRWQNCRGNRQILVAHTATVAPSFRPPARTEPVQARSS